MVKFEGKLRFLELDEKNKDVVYEILDIVLNFQNITMYRFFCYLGLKWPMFSSLLFIYYNMFASNACGTVGLLGEACYDLDNSTGNNIVI